MSSESLHSFIEKNCPEKLASQAETRFCHWLWPYDWVPTNALAIQVVWALFWSGPKKCPVEYSISLSLARTDTHTPQGDLRSHLLKMVESNIPRPGCLWKGLLCLHRQASQYFRSTNFYGGLATNHLGVDFLPDLVSPLIETPRAAGYPKACSLSLALM